MVKLSGSERKYLRGVAHAYRPVVQIGKVGLSESVLAAIETAIEANELIKVKIAAERIEREALVPVIEERINCECVATIGRIALFYRQHPEPDQRKVSLPGPGKDRPPGACGP